MNNEDTLRNVLLNYANDDFKQHIDFIIMDCLINGYALPSSFGFAEKGFGPIYE